MSRQLTNTAGMLAQRKKDSKTKRKTVLATIEAMERTGAPITIAEVARRAHVSPWLVRQEPLIQELRKAQKRTSQNESQGPSKESWESFRVERDLLRQENQKLRRETAIYRQRISDLLGDQIDGTDAGTQRRQSEELTSQNDALMRQASEAKQKLQQLQQEMTALSSSLEAAHTVNRSLMTELNRTRT